MNALKNRFFMVTMITFLSILCVPVSVLAKDAVGWHWYNEIYPENKKIENIDRDGKNKKENSATVQMEMFRKAVRAAKDKAILYPTAENMMVYISLQKLVMEKAMMFTRAWKRTLLEYPELDYNILHPAQNSAQHVLYDEVRKKEDAAIKAFSQKYGLLFFYRGDNPLDQELALTIESFSQENNISLIPVSVDGKNSTVFASSHVDSGQAEKLGVKHFPALILADPRNQKVRPLHYGFISASELRRRFLQIATNFQGGV